MSDHESRRRGRDRLRRLSEETEATEDRMGLERSRFARLADPASAPRVVSSFNLFQTPEPIARQMAERLGPVRGAVLEPSAGLGRLYRAVRAVAPEAPVTLVDVSPECCGELYRATEGDSAARLVQGDFLTMGSDRLGTFSAVLMNPPFKQGTDIKHIRHALGLLEPGGRLVALCADGPRQRAALEPLAASWEPLPAGSFRCEGTTVAVAMLTIER